MAEVDTFGVVFDGMPVGVAVFDRDGRFVYVNEVLARVNRRSVREHLGHVPVELFGPVVGSWVEHVQRVFRTGRAVGPFRFDPSSLPAPTSADGGGLWAYDVAYFPLGDVSDGVGFVGALVRDVSIEAGFERRAALVASTTTALAHAQSPVGVAHALLVGLSATGATTVTVAWVTGGGFETVATTVDPFTIKEDAATRARWRRAARQHDLGVIGTASGGVIVTVPVVDPGGRALGIVELDWSSVAGIDPELPAALHAIAAVTAGALVRVRLGDTVEGDMFRHALDTVLDDVTIGRAVRDGDGQITDFVVEWVNAPSRDGAGRRRDELIGRRVLDLYPKWVEHGLFDAFRAVVDTGAPLTIERFHYHDPTSAGPIDGWWRLQVVAFRDGYLAVSRDVTPDVLAARDRDREHARAAGERATVALLQELALPTSLPGGDGVEMAAHYQPVDPTLPVGGDWYDAFVLPDDRIGIVIGDVAGHGHVAAAQMIKIRTLLAAHAATGASPDVVLTRVNHTVGVDPFATVAYTIVDPAARTVTTANAGHLAPLVHTSGHGTGLLATTPGPPLGVDPTAVYTATTSPLTDDRVILVHYTDGLIERRDRSLDATVAELGDHLAAHVYLNPRQIIHQLIHHRPGRTNDDYCVLVTILEPSPRPEQQR